MSKFYICLIIWLIAANNWQLILARTCRIASGEQEHVHIKVHVPDILRKQTHQHYRSLKRPHYAKQQHLAPHYLGNSNFEHEISAIFTPYDLEVPATLPLLTSEHELQAHMGTASLVDNDIASLDIGNNLRAIREPHMPSPGILLEEQQLHELKPQLRYPTIIPPPPLASPLLTASAAFAGSNQMAATDDDFLRDLQQQQQEQLYATSKYKTLSPNILSSMHVNNMKKKKKLKSKRNKQNSNKYYVNEQLQLHQLDNNEVHGQHYLRPQQQQQYTYNNNKNNYNKMTRFGLMGTPLATDLTDIDAEHSNSNSEEEYDDNDNEENFEFHRLQQKPTESASIEHYQYEGGIVETRNGFSPVSYQQIFSTYAATPTTNHLSTQPTIRYKQPQPQQQQQQANFLYQKPKRQQIVHLSSMAPIVVTGTAGEAAAASGINNIYVNLQQQQQQQQKRYRKRKNRIKVKRNRL